MIFNHFICNFHLFNKLDKRLIPSSPYENLFIILSLIKLQGYFYFHLKITSAMLLQIDPFGFDSSLMTPSILQYLKAIKFLSSRN